MKKIWVLAVSAVMLLSMLMSCASGGDTTAAMKDYEQEKNYYIDDAGNTFYFAEADGESAILTKYVGKANRGDVVEIPAAFGKRAITAIGEGAFYGLTSIVEIADIPATVTEIGAYAFAGCTELTKINLPAGTVTIGESAFAGCGKLTTVNDTASLTALKTISDKAFWKCTSLAVINGGNLPETLATIGDAAFLGCASLTSVSFPESVEMIGDLAYYNCTGLVSIKLHNGFVKDSIGQYVFTTKESTLKDKIDLTGIVNRYVLDYVEQIAEPAAEDESES